MAGCSRSGPTGAPVDTSTIRAFLPFTSTVSLPSGLCRRPVGELPEDNGRHSSTTSPSRVGSSADAAPDQHVAQQSGRNNRLVNRWKGRADLLERHLNTSEPARRVTSAGVMAHTA